MRPEFLAAAASLWLFFVAGYASGLVNARGAAGLGLAVLWHGVIGYLVARAYHPRGGASTQDTFEVARNALLAMAVSLALGYGVGILVQGLLAGGEA